VQSTSYKLCASGDHYLSQKSVRSAFSISGEKQRRCALDSEGCPKLMGVKELADPTDPDKGIAAGLTRVQYAPGLCLSMFPPFRLIPGAEIADGLVCVCVRGRSTTR
jgi:hypothetical protein